MLNTTPVGTLLCQRNPYLTTSTSRISSIRQSTSNPSLFEVILSDTILFPTGGGQPHDLGKINGWEVVEVLRRGVECVHIIQRPSCSSAEDVKELKEGDEVLVELDWARRWDHMQQHSGQHLLSAIAERDFQLITGPWSLGKDRCFIELELDNRPAPTAEELLKLEDTVNATIRQGLKVEVHEDVHDDDPGVTKGEMKVKPDSLPDDLKEGAGGVVRCCGTHIRSTSELQCLKLLHTEKVRGKNIRLFFLFGDRVIKTFQASLERERALSNLLSTGPDQFPEKVSLLSKQLKDTLKLTRTQLVEISQLVALKITSPPHFPPPPHSTLENRLLPIAYHRAEADMDFLNSLAKVLSERGPGCVFILTTQDPKSGATIILQGPTEQSEYVNTLWKQLGEAMGAGGLKGGGKNGRFQGKVGGGWERFAEALKVVGAVVVKEE
ncbi:Alanyl-tRNA editing protein Aarsd1 [Chytridiales sp. JEL 0842]|nr:Alanyl-tRNA editing protein Aarsd1 [Chytridiales sp. JEL 0842]